MDLLRQLSAQVQGCNVSLPESAVLQQGPNTCTERLEFRTLQDKYGVGALNCENKQNNRNAKQIKLDRRVHAASACTCSSTEKYYTGLNNYNKICGMFIHIYIYISIYIYIYIHEVSYNCTRNTYGQNVGNSMQLLWPLQQLLTRG